MIKYYISFLNLSFKVQTANANLIGFDKNKICEFLYGKKNFKNGAFIASS